MGVLNFGNCGPRMRFRGEIFQAQKNDISGKTNQRESRREVGSRTKEDLYKFQRGFRTEPEISHRSPRSQASCLRWLEIQADAGGSQSRASCVFLTSAYRYNCLSGLG